MTTLNIELLDALKKAGVDEETARAAAKSVLSVDQLDQLVTKADLRAELADLKTELAELKVDLIKWMAGLIRQFGKPPALPVRLEKAMPFRR